jgi:hypothetical protein
VSAAADPTGTPAAIPLAAAMRALRITAENACLIADIRTLAVNPTAAADPGAADPSDSADDGRGGHLVTITAALEVTNKETQGLLRFTVNKKLTDTLGNTLAAPWEVIVNKE